MVPLFITWLTRRTHPPVVEVTELFDKDGFNRFFYDEIERVHARKPFSQEELNRLLQFDYVAYIDRSLLNAGFRPPDTDGLVHDMIVKMAVTGSLFSNLQGPFLPRFIASVRNSIITFAEKRKRNARRQSEYPLENVPQRPSVAGDGDIIQEFRAFVLRTLGEVALRVLDRRLDGEDTRSLRGQPGLESHHKLKQTVKALKTAARLFASNDPDLLRKIDAALDDEQETLQKRFSGTGF